MCFPHGRREYRELCRHRTPRIFAASEASRARSSAVPRVPISPCVRSRMPGVLAALRRFQQCAAAGLLHVITVGGNGQDVETLTLWSGDIHSRFPCSRTTFSRTISRCAAISLRVGSTRFTCSSVSTKMMITGSLPPVSTRCAVSTLCLSEKSGNAMDRRGREYVLFAQIVQDLHVQRPVMPLVGFVQIDCDLHRHGIWHSTRVPPIPGAACRTARSLRTDPICADARAGSPRTACRFSSECGRMPDCA